MEFRFETVCSQKAAAAMAKALRKTVRRKRSRRVHVFGWAAAALGLLLTLPLDGGRFSVGPRTAVTWAAVLVMAAALLFEDSINGYMARRRMLAGTERVQTAFREDGYTAASEIGKTEFRYESASLVAETGDYFVFVFSQSHAQVYDKASLSGGTAEEFRGFIERKTGRSVVKVD